MTAAERRQRAAAQYLDDLGSCPGHEVLAILSDKWTTLVLAALDGGPLRHGELARAVAGASQKMLTQTLRRLERDGLVTRTVTTAVPVKVDYRLTPVGRQFLALQAEVLSLGQATIAGIRASREAYDRQAEAARRP